MIVSMTGFGQAARNTRGFRLQVEIRSVNHRYGEISLRLPKEYVHLEEELKRETRHAVKRGRVDAFVSVEAESGAHGTVDVNWRLADQYIEAAGRLSERYQLTNTLTVKDLLAVPGMILSDAVKSPNEDAAADLSDELLECFKEALAGLITMRKAEGVHLLNDFSLRLAALEELLEKLRLLAPSVTEFFRERLTQRMKELLGEGNLDEQRIAAEAAIFAERSNVDEELTRLASHFQQFRSLLNGTDPSGRKLDFLLQEMNREANTIGAKGNNAGMASLIVDLKAELEKLREQVQNIE